jgi:hypothetical protein
MLYRGVIAVCSEIHTKHINTLCGQNVVFVTVKPDGAYRNHWALSTLQDYMKLMFLVRHKPFPAYVITAQNGSQHSYCSAVHILLASIT